MPYTKEWLAQAGFPQGHIYLGETQVERLALVRDLREKFNFVAGIGDRWDDNELHLEIGCLSIILQEHTGDWNSVPQRILNAQRQQKGALTMIANPVVTTMAQPQVDSSLQA